MFSNSHRIKCYTFNDKTHYAFTILLKEIDFCVIIHVPRVTRALSITRCISITEPFSSNMRYALLWE